MIGIVYCTSNKINGKKYIGSHSVKNLITKDPKYLGSGINIAKAIKKYGKSNFTRDTLWEGPIESMYKVEEYWCEYFNVKNSKLFYNCTNKGRGSTPGRKKPESFVNKVRGKPKLNKEWIEKMNKGREETYLSKERNTRISNKLKGRKVTWKLSHKKETRDTIGEKNKKNKCNKREIIKFSLDNKIIEDYNSIANAARSINIERYMVIRSSINDCLRGKTKTSYGFKWKYKINENER